MHYTAVVANRHFSRHIKYSDLDLTNLDSIIGAFAVRIEDWYLEPCRALRGASGHFAFAGMATVCLLIDTLSQFEDGKESSARSVFKGYVKRRLPGYACPLATNIDHLETDKNSGATNKTVLKDVADVLYHGFRCGILHQAHAPLYCSVDPGGQAVRQQASGKVIYTAIGADCPSVIINPWLLFYEMEKVFLEYVSELKDRDQRYDQLRTNFKKKFEDSFGVDLSKAK